LPSGISQVTVSNVDTLVDFFHQFQQGKVRFMLAFRHIEVDDPMCGLYLLSRLVPAAAKRRGISLHYPLHTHFLYDRGMPLWGGKGLGWALSLMGGVSLHRGRHPDWRALRIARNLMENGRLPLAVAPEGATNGHSEVLSPLEPGVAQLGFWCADDLVKAERAETVWIIPVGLQYHYPNPDWQRLDGLMGRLEAASGLSIWSLRNPDNEERSHQYNQRLLRLGTHLLTKMEEIYRRFYHRSVGEAQSSTPESLEELFQESSETLVDTLNQRLHSLMDNALSIAENYFGISSKGNFSDRCRRIEEAGWTYIYRQDVEKSGTMTSLDRGLGDWVAEEASLHQLHMRLVESFVAVDARYTLDKPSFERFAETTLILFDLLARVRGDKLPARPRLGLRHAHFTVGKPISVSDRYPAYQTSRTAARKAIADLTEELRQALQAMIC
jgi:hypothetical protein